MIRNALLLVVVLLVVVLMPFPKDNQDGAYNLTSHLAWCRTRAACLHEAAHALDQQAGWVSQSVEFHKTLQMYLFVEIYQQGVTQLPADILEITYRGDGTSGPIKRELYAFLFQYAQGDPERMPEALRKFYDWERAREYMQHINPEQTIYWMN
jgi:hypothetical protein